MQKVIIIGSGFSGISSAERLCRFKNIFEISIIDRQAYCNFLPMLPDTIGRGISPGHLAIGIEDISKKLGFRFIRDTVTSLDLDKGKVSCASGSYGYDYLIIASGSETNFYNNQDLEKYAYKLDCAEDAQKILNALKANDFDSYLISGGGYTGVETATNLRRYLSKRSKNKRVIIVERAPEILGPLPEWMKEYVLGNLQKLNIEVFCNTTVDKIEGRRVSLSGKGSFENAFLIWAAGVKTSGFVQNLSVKKNPQGRIMVDEFLRLNDRTFVVGDAANVAYGGGFLRMAVQFAIMQGRQAADNIINLSQGRPLKKYKPQDFGYIIPMANNRSCGKIFGVEMRGYLPTLFHFFMCIYRSYGLKNQFGIVKDLLK